MSGRNIAILDENQRLHLENTALREALVLAIKNIEAGGVVCQSQANGNSCLEVK